MKLIASLHAYDCLSQVVATVIVREYRDYEQGDSEEVLNVSISFPGKGIGDPDTWLETVFDEILRAL